MAIAPKGKPFDFVYYVYSEALVGSLHGESFVIQAYSGGGRGKTRGKPEYSLASFSAHKATNDAKGVRGGALPPGRWRIEKPSSYKGKMKSPVSKLTPIGDQVVDYPSREYKKVPFLIHGPGEKGSDGCIVIDRVHRTRLLKAVEKAGGAVLFVTTELTDDDMLSRAQRRDAIA